MTTSKFDSSTDSTTLAKPDGDRTPPVITTPDEYRHALLRWQAQRYHVLAPFTQLSAVAPSHGLITSLVQIDTDKDAGEIYDNSGGLPWLRDGEVALAKRGLRKIAECAGISTQTQRTDPRTIPYYWEMKAIATYRGIDGAVVTREATTEWDLRDGSDRLKGFRPNQITEARKNGLRNCEARAVNAVIRECGCGLKQKYTRAELAKPFVAVRVMFLPDMTDDVVRRQVTERALQGTATLYPHARELPPATANIIDVDPDPPAAPPSPTPTAEPTAPATPAIPEGFGLLQKVERTEVKRRDGKTFPKWTAIDTDGVPHVTTHAKVGAKLERCFAARIPVDITSESNDYDEYVITEVFEHDPAQPSLPNVDRL